MKDLPLTQVKLSTLVSSDTIQLMVAKAITKKVKAVCMLCKKNNHGFTMIELLMVIMLVSILGSLALPQYLDFRKEGRFTAAKQAASSFNVGIKLQLQQARLKCGVLHSNYPPIDSIAANDITAGATPFCTAAQIPNSLERRFIGSNQFPENPYNGLTTVSDCVSETYVGWCYSQATGSILASPKTSEDAPVTTDVTATCTGVDQGNGSYVYTVTGNCVNGSDPVLVGATSLTCSSGSFTTTFSAGAPSGQVVHVTQGANIATGTCN